MIHEVLRDSVVYGLATILSRGVLVITLLVLSKILPPADYGALSMIAAVGALAYMTVALEISQALARHYGEASETDKRIYAGTAWWFTVVMFVLFTVVTEIAALRGQVPENIAAVPTLLERYWYRMRQIS